MLETGILRGSLPTGGIDHGNKFACGSRATSVCGRAWDSGRIFRRKQIAGRRGGRGTRNDELMRWEAGALIGLKHPVGEGVGLGHLEIRGDVAGLDVSELRIGWGADGLMAKQNRDFVGS